MRDIETKKKIEIFFSDTQLMIGLVVLVLGFFMMKSSLTPLSIKPMVLSVISSENDGKITNVMQGEDGYYSVIVDFKTEDGTIDRRTTKTEQAIQIGSYVNVKEFPMNKNWFVFEGDKWNSEFVLPLIVMVLGIVFFIPSAKQKWKELKLFVYGQVTVANLTSKEKLEKGGYSLGYEFYDNKKEKQKIEIIKKGSVDVEKSVKILYLDENPEKFMVVRKEYDVDLYRI